MNIKLLRSRWFWAFILALWVSLLLRLPRLGGRVWLPSLMVLWVMSWLFLRWAKEKITAVRWWDWVLLGGIGLPLGVLLMGFSVPERLIIPVQGATIHDWNHETFWFEPWGMSGVHKGIDIFAAEGTPVLSATRGLVIRKQDWLLGGHTVLVLGPKWRLHYYAHLKEPAQVFIGQPVRQGQQLGQVGRSGNAASRPPHLHYGITTLIPYPWRADNSTQGHLKMYYLNPSEKLLKIWGVTSE